jgi:hypothetical protein
MIYYAQGTALVTEEELFDSVNIDRLAAFYGELKKGKEPRSVPFSTGELTAENAVTEIEAIAGANPIPFQEIGPGLPLTVMIKEVYTGRFPNLGFLTGDGKDFLLTSAIKSIASFEAKPRAVNFLMKKVAKKSRLDRPPASSQGTPIIFYSPALLERSLTLDLTMVFDMFPQEVFEQVGAVFQAAAGIPIFLPHSTYLLAAGLIAKLAGNIGEAIFDGQPVFNSSDGIDINLPGRPPLPPGFVLVTSDNVDNLDSQFRANHHVDPSTGQVVNQSGDVYSGDVPYIVISLDGTRADELADFTPTAAGAAILSRFFGMKEGQSQPLDILVEALKLYNDLSFRHQVDKIDRQLKSVINNEERKRLEEKKKALVANIWEDILKPTGLVCANCNATLTPQASMPAQRQSSTITAVSLETLVASEIKVRPNMDPRLQRVVMRMQQGIRKLPTSSTSEDEVAVVAKVTDVASWEALSEVRVGIVIESGDGDGTAVVTGRIPVGRVEYVREQPFVKSLKAAQSLRPNLDKTIAETGALTNVLPSGHMADGGQGVVVGIVDFGCDYLHDNFRNPDGSTRILAIWDQTDSSGTNSPAGYGKIYTKPDIDAALQHPDPYAALGYAPRPDGNWGRGTHGTHVMDIAAGNGRGSNVPGVAPKADIVFVEVSASDVLLDGPEAVGKSFGDSVQLLEAIRFIFDFAKGRPCVINVSLGTNGGPHDGTTLVEDGIDRLINQASNRAVVIAASNSFADGIHAAGTVPANGFTDLIWLVPSNDATNNEMEIWYAGSDRFEVEVIAPNGSSLVRVGPGQSKALASGSQTVLLTVNRLADPNNGDNLIDIFLERGLPIGKWTIRLHGLLVQDGRFHAWIERDDIGQSSFPESQDNSHTIGSISCGHQTVVVGSYDAHKTSLPLSFFSSAGPTRDGRKKPEVSAPGHAVLAAHSRTGSGVIRKSGTSMASPVVTGIIALMLGEARARGISLNTGQIRDLLTQAARKNPPVAPDWDSRFGHGRVSAATAVTQIIAMTPTPLVAAVREGGTRPARSARQTKGKAAEKAVR